MIHHQATNSRSDDHLTEARPTAISSFLPSILSISSLLANYSLLALNHSGETSFEEIEWLFGNPARQSNLLSSYTITCDTSMQPEPENPKQEPLSIPTLFPVTSVRFAGRDMLISEL